MSDKYIEQIEKLKVVFEKDPRYRQFVQMLVDDGYSYILPIDEERYACINQFMYSTAIITGKWFGLGYEDRWCYDDPGKAVGCLLQWAMTTPPFAGEPRLWHRHPGSGRRRPDGDETREYINP